MPQKTYPIIQDDPWLKPYQEDIDERYMFFSKKRKEIEKEEGSLLAYAHRDLFLGFNYDTQKKGWRYREWAPAAQQLWLIGDFNRWNPESHPLEKREGGIWEIFIPDGENGLAHRQLLKVKVLSNDLTRD
ncbi:MAG TPA: 1,4-alpha-glucan-branching enzyme, partial [Cryomorphaceae bacterium]|nr:1,4-alpha-glucan-branching enzyme [Cryomorphaceae bacterium]